VGSVRTRLWWISRFDSAVDQTQSWLELVAQQPATSSLAARERLYSASAILVPRPAVTLHSIAVNGRGQRVTASTPQRASRAIQVPSNSPLREHVTAADALMSWIGRHRAAGVK